MTEGVMPISIPRWLRREKGQGLVEYALIILLVSTALVGTLSLFGASVDGFYRQAVAALSGS
jgi:Flp pilus assembly pilin Flp